VSARAPWGSASCSPGKARRVPAASRLATEGALPGTVSDSGLLLSARRLRAFSWWLEIVLGVAVAGSVAALASVRSWAQLPLFLLGAAALAFAALRAREVRRLRERLGERTIAFHPSGRWLSFDAHPTYGLSAWSFDLQTPLVPAAPLLRPGLAFVAWVALQLVPMPAGIAPGTLSRLDTLRGLGFLLAMLALHTAAAASFAQREARQRFRRLVAVVGLTVSLVALVQVASGTSRIYGLFEPLESGAQTLFGPFVNRNHFGGYMLLALPIALGLLRSAASAYRRRIGSGANVRRVLVSLGAVEGTELLFAALAPVACLAGLVASTSRGALLAFVLSAVLVLLQRRRRDGLLFAGLALAAGATVFGAYGLERIEARLETAGRDRAARTLVWQDAVSRMGGYWLRGSGFNTFAWAMSRAVPFEMPVGATPWPDDVTTSAISPESEWPAIRVPTALPGLSWYREAHNDYVQLLVETGLPGLLLALWGAARLLRAARADSWLLAAVTALLLHELVDFDLQIPAIAVLFATTAALRPLPRPSR
jgi:O-antigen ligase